MEIDLGSVQFIDSVSLLSVNSFGTKDFTVGAFLDVGYGLGRSGVFNAPNQSQWVDVKFDGRRALYQCLYR